MRDADVKRLIEQAVKDRAMDGQPKEWVGLTSQEFNEIKDSSTTIGYAILQTEAKLKEKNGG